MEVFCKEEKFSSKIFKFFGSGIKREAYDKSEISKIAQSSGLLTGVGLGKGHSGRILSQEISGKG